MKLVKEHINEIFIEDSDPIHDLGIGIIGIYNNLKRGDILFVKNDINPSCPSIFPIIGDYLLITNVEKRNHEDKIKRRITCKVYKNENDLLKEQNKKDLDMNNWGIGFQFFKESFNFLGNIKDLKESLNEKFTEDSDPIHDMSIGFLYVHRNFNTEKKFFKFMLLAIPAILKTDKIPEDFVTKYIIINNKYWRDINDYVEKYLSYKNISLGYYKCKIWPYNRPLSVFVNKNMNKLKK